jgi:DNA-directed RNA polymerase specialized sigma24 family protein
LARHLCQIRHYLERVCQGEAARATVRITTDSRGGPGSLSLAWILGARHGRAGRSYRGVRIQTPATDTELWTAGDAAAFGQLFERHARAVYNHAFRLCGSWSVAEDVTQTTLPPEPEGAPDLADDVADRLRDEQRMRELLALVRKLPRAEREALALCVWSGVAYPQAAITLGVTEGAVRSRVSRARARLARMVATQTEEER